MKCRDSRTGRYVRTPKSNKVGFYGTLVAFVLVATMNVMFVADAHIEPEPVIVEQYHEWEPRVVQIGTRITDEEAYIKNFFKDIPILIEVSRCESTLTHTREDGSVLQGRVDKDDIGAMQINKRYHLKNAQAMGLDIEDLHDNLTFALHLYKTEGLQPWSASKSCWGV